MRQAVESPASTASIPFSLTLLSFQPEYFILKFSAVCKKADVELEKINPIKLPFTGAQIKCMLTCSTIAPRTFRH